MYTRTLTISIALAALSAAPAGIAHGLNTFDEESPEVRDESRQDERLDRMEPEDSRWVIEENQWDEYRERQDVETARQDKPRETDGFSNRFVNPRPELGCLYYDENNIRHWYPNCREL